VPRVAAGIARGKRALRNWRESQIPRVTQDSLGRDVGVSGSAIRHFENGTEGFDLSLHVKVRLSRRTGVALAWLLNPDELSTVRQAYELLGEDNDGAGAAA